MSTVSTFGVGENLGSTVVQFTTDCATPWVAPRPYPGSLPPSLATASTPMHQPRNILPLTNTAACSVALTGKSLDIYEAKIQKFTCTIDINSKFEVPFNQSRRLIVLTAKANLSDKFTEQTNGLKGWYG